MDLKLAKKYVGQIMVEICEGMGQLLKVSVSWRSTIII